MVAEKPSVARLMAECLCGSGRVRERRGLSPACPVLEFVAVTWRWFEVLSSGSDVFFLSLIGYGYMLFFSMGFHGFLLFCIWL